MKHVLIRRILSAFALSIGFGLIAFFGDEKPLETAVMATFTVLVFLAVLAVLTAWPRNPAVRFAAMVAIVVFLVVRRPRGADTVEVSYALDFVLNIGLVGLCVALLLLGSFFLRIFPPLRSLPKDT